MFLYYRASGVLTGGIGLNYFYLSLGYGSGKGGLVSTVISVMYVLAMVSSQALYPVIAKKLSKQKILTITFIIQMIGFAGFMLCCVPMFNGQALAFNTPTNPEPSHFFDMDLGWAFGGTMFLYYLFPFIFFFGMGMMYLAIMVMFQDAIDYNEYKYGERKESITSAWRPLDVKLSSALLRGFQFIIFTAAGLIPAVNAISNAESAHNIRAAQHIGETGWVDTAFVTEVNDIYKSVGKNQIVVAGIMIVVVLVVSIVAAWALMHFGYTITEESHAEIVKELEKRHVASEVAAGEEPEHIEEASAQ